MQAVTIVAKMIDGTCLVERVTAFEDFTALVLGFRRDGECLRVTWHPSPDPPEPPARGSLLPHLADRLATDRSFVAGRIATPALMAATGCDEATAVLARLCRYPRNAGDVRRIAGRFGLAVDALAALIGKREA